METKSCTENDNKYLCIICDYTTSRKSSLYKHFSTVKHSQCANSVATCDTISDANINGKVAKSLKSKQDKIYSCDKCTKIYNSRNGLWKHKQQLCVEEEITDTTDQTLVTLLIKQNQEFKEMIVEQNKTIVDAIKQCSANISNNTVNSHNKTFNLQVFLNEDCKDAMNVSDFMNSLNLQISDLECVGKLGFVEGISNIIIKRLNALDITKRPVHCTDQKREIVYIKENGVWTKDDDNMKIRKLVRGVSSRNCKNAGAYKAMYPECKDPKSKHSYIYDKIVLEAFGGTNNGKDDENENKIIRKILKHLTIDKAAFIQ